MNAEEILKKYFGYNSFKADQEKIINTIMDEEDVLAVMPTGAGKSICYQIPALMLPGITIVVSPLISLMQDQVRALNAAGIYAAYINSSLTEGQINKVLEFATNGKYKIIYVAPERLENEKFLRFAEGANISMIAVDEAHCISHWGQDFRPSYLKIVRFIKCLSKRPIISAFTATATPEVMDDIIDILDMNIDESVVAGFDRENLYYEVKITDSKIHYINEYVKKHSTESGIIYCATRANVDEVYEFLHKKERSVAKYHAGMDNDARKEFQEEFLYDAKKIMVATNAFGMGIDKSNVRYVIHYNMPQSMENYYQEAGRAGRDGAPAQCVLLFSEQDIVLNRFLLEQKEFGDIDSNSIEIIQQKDMQRLRAMEGYCRTPSCLRKYILDYFGQWQAEPCDNCGNCHAKYQEIDMTEEAKWVINCVAETKGRFGPAIVIATLLGRNRARIRELGMTSYKSYGKLKGQNKAVVRQLIEQLVSDGFLYTTEKYNLLSMGEISALKKEETRIVVKMKEELKGKNSSISGRFTSVGRQMFETLRKLRYEIAQENSFPPYVVFSDKTLIDMCKKSPTNREEMLNVSGVGEAKYEKYGKQFLDAIKEFKSRHSGEVIDIYNTEKEIVKPIKKRQRKYKEDFYLKPEDTEKFVFQDLYTATEIRNELNRITTAENVKKMTTKEIVSYLVSDGLIRKQDLGSKMVNVSTEKGQEMGVTTVSKISMKGSPYDVLMYPPKIQKCIISRYVRTGER